MEDMDEVCSAFIVKKEEVEELERKLAAVSLNRQHTDTRQCLIDFGNKVGGALGELDAALRESDSHDEPCNSSDRQYVNRSHVFDDGQSSHDEI